MMTHVMAGRGGTALPGHARTMVVWVYRRQHEPSHADRKTGDEMHQYGVARSDQSVAGYGNPTGYDSITGYGTTHGATTGYGSTPVVSFENVSKYYGSLKAVDGLNLDLRAGETTALLGPNGAGKSTSLDMLLALRKPTSGKITMFGSDPYHAVKTGRVGAMLQSGGLMPEVTVRELVTLVTTLQPNPEPIQTTLKRAGIAEFA